MVKYTYRSLLADGGGNSRDSRPGKRGNGASAPNRVTFVRSARRDCQKQVHSLFPFRRIAIVDIAAPLRLQYFIGGCYVMLRTRAKYHLGQIVRHRKHPLRGVVFDVDAMFSNTDEWYDAIPEESRPSKDQPFYHLLAENDQNYYVAYVSEQNLIADYSGKPVTHPDLPDLFGDFEDGQYPLQFQLN